MTGVLLPIAHFWLVVGTTIDIINYNFGIDNFPIYNETDVVENPLSSFKASYYVLPDEKFPYEKLRLPVDYLLVRSKQYNSQMPLLSGYRQSDLLINDAAIVLIVAEYKTSEKTVKDNTNPTPKWQDRIRDRDHHTHYVDKIVYGSRIQSVVYLKSPYKGDIQVFRRILKDTMGTSGSITADTVEMWKKAEKAIRESPDVRGEIFMGDVTESINAALPDTEGKIENLFRYVSELPKYIEPSRDDTSNRYPLYVSFKALHDLDKRYPAVQKDVEGERYLAQLYRLMRDITLTELERDLILGYIPVENARKYEDFNKNLLAVNTTLMKASYANLSAYQTVNKTALQEAFKQYAQGLDKTTITYLAQFRSLQEQIGTDKICGDRFYTPTSGMLRVTDNEVVNKGRVENVGECQDFCVADEKCRAFGYSDEECLVYYRSTFSAVITSPSGNMKIYDRKCRSEYDVED